MSSKKYAAPLRLEVGASARLRVMVIATHAGAVMILPLLTPLDSYLRLLIGLAVLGNLVVCWQRRSELNGKLVTLTFNNGRWMWENGTAVLPVMLLAGSYVTPHLVILNFREAGDKRRRSIVLPGDNCDREGLRRLRVRVKHAVQEPLSGSS